MNTKKEDISQRGKKAVTLAQVLREWEKGADDHPQNHLSSSSLRAFLKGDLDRSDRDGILNHLSDCHKCRERLWAMDRLTGKADILDLALPKAAATPKEASFSFLTEGKRYRITCRRLLNQERKGVLTLKVENPYRDEMEGRSVVVMDSVGREILRGIVHKGETPGSIVDPGEIDWETIVVREGLSR